ncbi:MAG: hypothetical protein SGILL_004581 [Bacillariaceae sp.]
MVLKIRTKKPAASPARDDERGVEDPPMAMESEEDVGLPQPASDLIGPDSSALSLDGRSLIVPNDSGDLEDMSSLGTSKYGGFNFSTGNAIGYIGNMKIVGRASEDYDNVDGPQPPYRSPNPSPYRHSSSGGGEYDFAAGDYSVQTEEKERRQPEQYTEPIKEDEKVFDDDEKQGCLPLWIADAPFWLKIVMICSAALLIGAIVLIGVGASLAMNKSSAPSSSSNQDPVVPATPAPTIAPGPDSSPISLTSAPEVTTPPVSAPTAPPTFASVATEPPVVVATTVPAETSAPTATTTSKDTATGTEMPAANVINFFTMGGRFDEEDELTILNAGLPSLPNMDGNTILFHLGDWNSPYATSCVESSFTDNVDLFSQSSIPVYFVPGDNEFNDCPDPNEAFGFWYDYILGFETKYWLAPSWNIARQEPDHPENFSFLQDRVLFLGLNLVGGIVHDQPEWDARHAANLAWVNQTVATMDGTYDTMIVLAHADPDIDINDNFFSSFLEMVRGYDEKVIYMHRNLGIDSWQLEPQFNGIANLDVVVVEGSLWPPMWFQLDLDTGNFAIDQGSWYQDYISSGDMPYSPSL